MDISGKCAIITGGSSGIGKAIGELLTRRGANVFLIARREAQLKAACIELKQQAANPSQKFGYYSADVAELEAVRVAVKAAERECGPIAVLVNSAGFVNAGYIEKIPISGIETELKVNYLGTVYTVKQVVEGMIRRRNGWILNISSLAGLKGIFGYTGYCGSKFAVVGFSEALRSELRPYGIKVSVLCPPDVDTPMLRAENKGKPLETLRISEGAKLMQPGDVARVALRELEKGTFIIMPNFSSKMLGLANRLVPSVVDRRINKTVDQARKERGL